MSKIGMNSFFLGYTVEETNKKISTAIP